MEVDRAAKPAKIPAKYLSPTEVKVSPSLRPCLFVRLSKILFEYAIPSCDAGYDEANRCGCNMNYTLAKSRKIYSILL